MLSYDAASQTAYIALRAPYGSKTWDPILHGSARGDLLSA
jgi:hypothetical protein